MLCRECGESKGHHEDPRDPPTDEGKCLCRRCLEAAIEEAIDEHEYEIDTLRELAAEKKIKLTHRHYSPKP